MKQNISTSLGKIVALAIVVGVVGALSGCSPTSTQVESPTICGELNSAIDRNIVEIAVSEVEGVMSDKSAVQQSARLAQNSNRWSAIMANIQLQTQNKCSPRQKPIDASIYATQASDCYIARLKEVSAGYGSEEKIKTAAKAISAQACDLKSWETPAKK